MTRYKGIQETAGVGGLVRSFSDWRMMMIGAAALLAISASISISEVTDGYTVNADASEYPPDSPAATDSNTEAPTGKKVSYDELNYGECPSSPTGRHLRIDGFYNNYYNQWDYRVINFTKCSYCGMWAA